MKMNPSSCPASGAGRRCNEGTNIGKFVYYIIHFSI
jgi:hypothetical protein